MSAGRSGLATGVVRLGDPGFSRGVTHGRREAIHTLPVPRLQPRRAARRDHYHRDRDLAVAAGDRRRARHRQGRGHAIAHQGVWQLDRSLSPGQGWRVAGRIQPTRDGLERERRRLRLHQPREHDAATGRRHRLHGRRDRRRPGPSAQELWAEPSRTPRERKQKKNKKIKTKKKQKKQKT
eukprot:TRINITY_DN24229_c0_g1_i14.p2 TRINITY_DN24229_c0_g1~~TRINITY_DN24229_c0_g1_i14.p2  ORF type:complete len:195 (+),score=19.93 TRINITY_DN24229_c0_g1_i14:48-587(+)